MRRTRLSTRSDEAMFTLGRRVAETAVVAGPAAEPKRTYDASAANSAFMHNSGSDQDGPIG
eukprot:2940343-Pleurochrysis_carterae.AAC.1